MGDKQKQSPESKKGGLGCGYIMVMVQKLGRCVLSQ